MKVKLRFIKDTFFTKYWSDPVWSKVISAGIIAVIGSVLTTLYVLVKSIYEKVPFRTTIKQLTDYFRDRTEINNLLIWIAILIIVFTLFSFLKSFIRDLLIKLKSPKVDVKEEPKEIPTIIEHSTVFFSFRLAKAFPGQRGLVWYQPKVAVERLKILLQDPLRFKSVGHDSTSDPIWWFRGGSALFIEKFKALSKTKILIDVYELELKRIAVFISDSYYKSFIYVESKGEKQTGLYNYKTEDIKRHIETFGYSSEEFGLLGKKPIRREQYDDGATILKDKVVDATNAELRVRYLSDYNFILAAKQSPYNSKRFDRETKTMFNNLLNGNMLTDAFFEYVDNFVKYES
jgi:hypothetical protein